MVPKMSIFQHYTNPETIYITIKDYKFAKIFLECAGSVLCVPALLAVKLPPTPTESPQQSFFQIISIWHGWWSSTAEALSDCKSRKFWWLRLQLARREEQARTVCGQDRRGLPGRGGRAQGGRQGGECHLMSLWNIFNLMRSREI